MLQYRRKKVSGLILGTALLIVVSFSCAVTFFGGVAQTKTRRQSMSPTIHHHSIGEKVSAGTWEMTIRKVSTSTADPFEQLQPGETYLLLTLSITNTLPKSQAISSLLELQVQKSDGTIAAPAMTTPDQALVDGTLAPGMTIQDTLAYPVPQSEHHFVLSYPNMLTDQVVLWDISS